MSTITIIVKDQLGAPIKDVSITLKNKTNITDTEGKATFYRIRYGTYDITASF